METEELLLRRGAELRCRIPLGQQCISIGAAPYCDWMIHDACVPAELVLVQRMGEQVRVYDLRSGSLGSASLVGRNSAYPLHERWSLERNVFSGERVKLLLSDLSSSLLIETWELKVGRGSSARTIRSRRRPITIGSDDRNDVVLHDPLVDAFHCRLEPHAEGWIVRDLGSQHGIWLDGHRIGRASVHGYIQLRVGHSDLFFGRAEQSAPEDFVAASSAMREVLERLRTYADVSWPLLLLGETGVGKEVVAKRAHGLGPRRNKPFVAVNAGSFPPHLVESELFGHERGAFTNAHGLRRGVFEQADGGTLFLDEIGELPIELQSRLLRVLETQCVRRLGSETEIPSDFRLICATHRDLRSMVAEGRFREDLYHRIRRLVIEIPPLRSRLADVVPLAEHFLLSMQSEVGCRTLSSDARGVLLRQPWHGNARELRNVISTAALDTAHAEINAVDVERVILSFCGWNPRVMSPQRLNEVVAVYGGNIAAAARSLGMPRTTLRDRLRLAQSTVASSSESASPAAL